VGHAWQKASFGAFLLAHNFLSSICYAAKVMVFIQTWIISPLCSLHGCTILPVAIIIRFVVLPISEWYLWIINPLKHAFLINIVESYPQTRVRKELSVEKLVFFGAVNRREAAVQIFTCFLCPVPRFKILKLCKTGMIELEPSSGTGDCLIKKTRLSYATLEVNYQFSVLSRASTSGHHLTAATQLFSFYSRDFLLF